MRARWHLIAPLTIAGSLAAGLTGADFSASNTSALNRPAGGNAIFGNQFDTSDFHYMYFKSAVPLSLEYGRIAAFPGASSSHTSLQDHGFAPVDIEDSAIRGIKYLFTSPTVDNERAVRQLVSTMAADASMDWVSPVLLDELGDPVLVTPHMHISFDPSISAEHAETLLAQWIDGEIVERDWAHMDGTYRVLANERDGFKVLEKVNWIARQPEVLWAESDMVRQVHHSLIPNDPSFGVQWGLHNTGQSGGTTDMDMDCPEAWDLVQGDPDVFIVVLDDGVQQDHPDINQRAGADFTGNGTGGGPENYCDNHGTAVAGCISATINNGLGVAGAAPACRAASAKWSVANTPCDGSGSFYVSWLVDAIDWADTIGACATNNSNGFGSQSSITSKYQETRNNGVVHFASSGNDGTSTIGYPGSLSTVNAVGAISRSGNRASFSTYGTGLAYMAPGVSVYTTDRTGSSGYGSSDYDYVDGTSFASPYAAAMAGLICSANDALTVDEIETIMETTCTDRGAAGYDTTYGFGIVNAYGAVVAAGGGGGYCSAGSDDTTDEYISNVTVGTLDNDSGRASYSNFTSMTVTMAIGVGYDITVTNGETFADDQCGIWVDWNQDEDFGDAGETIAVSGTPGVGPYTGTITPPAGALTGSTRMRIRVMYTGTVSPCGNSTYGEVEDYTIEVSGEVEGACCLTTGGCAYGTPALCLTFGGQYMGDGTTCASITCPFGACCYTGGACEDKLEDACIAAGGTYQGAGTECSSYNCPEPEGACCLIGGSCAFGTESLCISAGGIYQGDDVLCSQVTCVPRGACCWADTSCSDQTEEAACIAGGGTYMGNVTYCSSVTCPDAEGACCWQDGSCTMETQAGCISVDGTYQGDGTDCGSVECPQPNACPWDTAPEGGDDTVGLGDLNALLSNWGACPAPCAWDYTDPADGVVGLGDLNALLSNWGPCP